MKNRILCIILLLTSFSGLFGQGLIIHKQAGLKDTVVISTVDSITFTQSLRIHRTSGALDSVEIKTIDSLSFDSSINPAPVITSISPTTAVTGSSEFLLTVKGRNFLNNSVIKWNGAELVTDFVASTELQATVPAMNIATSGAVNITVFTPGPGGGTSPTIAFSISDVVITKEDFETGAKGSYAAANATLGTGIWTLTDALIGNSTSDIKNGNQSVRMRNTGKLTMLFNLTSGAGTVSIQHAMYGNDAASKWQLWYSVDDGNVWSQADSTISTSTKTFQTAAFTLNMSGMIRFEIRKTEGGTNRINFDDITITSYGASNTNPVPVIGSLSPASDTLGAGDLTLTVKGSKFGLSSVVVWNGVNLTTAFISDSVLQAIVPAANFAVTGTASVAVFTPNGGKSGYLTFAIDFGSNSPVPQVSYLTPATCVYGRSSFVLSVTGSNFVKSSVVTWNGSPLTTTYVSVHQVQAEVTADLVSNYGNAGVAVYTAPPNGGTSSNLTFTIYQTAPKSTNVNLTMGNPSGAVADTNYPSNFLIQRGQLCTSYNRDRGIPNWVSWVSDASWLGTASRGSFKTDQLVPAQWYRVSTNDYTSTGFNRGHMCPSADRTLTEADNDSVFFMTNIIPQSGPQNGGPWGSVESYCRNLATLGYRSYIYAGAVGEGGTGTSGYMTTFAGGKVTVPAKTWKVVLVLPPGGGVAGESDIARVDTTTRCIGVIFNNDQGPFNDWTTYRVSVDSVEALTGYDFFSNVPADVQNVIESKVDTQ